MQNYITNSMPNYITNWLNTNVNPVGSAVVVDSSLTVSGAAADAKKVGDEIANLDEKIPDLKSAFVSNGQLIDPTTIGIFTGYITGLGVFKMSSSYRTLYLPCIADTIYSISEKEYSSTNRMISFSINVPIENASSTFIGAMNEMNPTYFVKPANSGFICITFYNRSVDDSVDSALANIKIQEGSEITEGFEYGEILPIVTYGGLNTIMLEKDKQYTETTKKLEEIYNVNTGKNIIDIAKAINGYYISLSGVQSNENYKYFEYIQIKANTTYTIYQSGGSANTFACVFYDENKIALSYYSPFTSATSPANAKYMRVSCAISTVKISIVEGNTSLDIPYWKKINGEIVTNQIAPKTIKNHADSMTANDTLNINIPDIKKNGVYGLHMNITTMGSFTFGPGRTKANRSAFITVDDTNITINYYANSETKTWATFEHGLTITDELDIVIVQANNSFGEASIKISSSGSSYKVPQLQYWKGNDTPLTLQVVSGTYTDVDMTYYCIDYTKDLYIFGDSYLDHWPRYVMNTAQNNYQNYLLDGYGGRASLDAVASLRFIEASCAIPRKLFWCMGMNDGDSSAINTNWMKALNIIIDFCNQYNVELILCTIPNVATINNTYKNDYIRSSGYRYVDLAKAVGSDISTSWFAGLLSNDGIHPSTIGDKMIADFMISQIPEMI